MMKKFLMFLILFLLPMTVSAETTYSPTLENGRLILVDGGMGVGRYADRSSVTAQMYDPPIYQLSIKVYSVEFSDEYYREHGTYIGSPYKINSDFVMDCQFKYDWNSKMLYVLNNGIWRDWNVYEEHSHADGDPLFPNSAEVAFVTNYGMKFFGGVKKYSKYTDQYYDVIDSDLYDSLFDVLVYQDSNSFDYYVDNSSISNQTKYRDDRTFSVNVKKFHDGQLISTDKFNFRENDGLLYFSVNGSTDNFVMYDGTTPIAASVWNHCIKYLGIDYEISYR